MTQVQQAFLDRLVLQLVKAARKPLDRDTDKANKIPYQYKLKAKFGKGGHRK